MSCLSVSGSHEGLVHSRCHVSAGCGPYCPEPPEEGTERHRWCEGRSRWGQWPRQQLTVAWWRSGVPVIPFPFLLGSPFPPALRTQSHPAPAPGLETEGWVCGANEGGSVSSSVQWVLQAQRMSKCLRTVGALGTRLYLLPSQLSSFPLPWGTARTPPTSEQAFCPQTRAPHRLICSFIPSPRQ